MKTTVAELKNYLADVPDDFDVRVVIPCRASRAVVFDDVEKDVTGVKTRASRRLITLETEILDLGPK